MSNPTPQADGFRLVTPYARHARTLLLWPTAISTHPYALEDTCEVVAALAHMIAEFEAVTVIARPDQIAEVSLRCGEGVAILGLDYHDDDIWIGDIGPSMLADDSDNVAGLIHDQQHAHFAHDLLERLSLTTYKSKLDIHRGLFESDGQGRLLLYCDADKHGYPIDPPTPFKENLSHYFGSHHLLPVTSSLSVKEGGHLDQVARFTTTEVILVNEPEKGPGLARLYDRTDLALNVIPVPRPRHAKNGSYLDFYPCNGAIFVPRFEDPHDARAGEIIGSAFPDRVLRRPAALMSLELGCNRLALAQCEEKLDPED